MGIILATFLILAFVGAVVPLVTGRGGATTAEVNGQFPSQITAGQTVGVPLAIDNTGDQPIGPFCVRITIDPPVTITATTLTFQGLDTVQVRDGQACGGSLGGGQVISATLLLRGSATGSARVTTAPLLQGREVGPERSSIVAVVQPGG